MSTSSALRTAAWCRAARSADGTEWQAPHDIDRSAKGNISYGEWPQSRRGNLTAAFFEIRRRADLLQHGFKRNQSVMIVKMLTRRNGGSPVSPWTKG
jgi:hypothetical protein